MRPLPGQIFKLQGDARAAGPSTGLASPCSLQIWPGRGRIPCLWHCQTQFIDRVTLPPPPIWLASSNCAEPPVRKWLKGGIFFRGTAILVTQIRSIHFSAFTVSGCKGAFGRKVLHYYFNKLMLAIPAVVRIVVASQLAFGCLPPTGLCTTHRKM